MQTRGEHAKKDTAGSEPRREGIGGSAVPRRRTALKHSWEI